MRGIDISGWQSDINLFDVNVDFAIMKATEGIGFTDTSCDRHVQQAIEKEICWGFYCFARENDPIAEANYFMQECENYFGQGIPILDYETVNYDDATWCEAWMKIVHDATGIWPMLYTSASWLPKFAGSWIPEKCGLWLAGYPYPAKDWTTESPYDYYSPEPWEFTAIWQFTSSLRLNGYWSNLDGNIAYMDASQWALYATGGKAQQPSKPSLQPTLNETELLREILAGKWGTNKERRNRLTNAGYDADYLQAKINDYYDIAEEIIKGNWGNGWNREQALKGAGYDYEIAQSIVNAILNER